MKKLSLLLTAFLCASMFAYADPIVSEYCGEIFQAGTNTEAAFTWQTDDNGAIIITISETLGGADDATHFRGNGINIDKIEVGETREPAATYFNLSCPNKKDSIILSLNDPANAPELGTKIYVTSKIVEYATSKDGNAWPTLTFEYTYGGKCSTDPVLTRIILTAAVDFAIVGEEVALTAQAKDQLNRTMDAEITYEISPVDAGTIKDGIFTPSKLGAITITAKSGEVSASIVVYGVPSENLALNKTVKAGYEPGNTGELSSKMVDGNVNTQWVTYADQKPDVEWAYVDLGSKYSIKAIDVVWGDPCSTNYILQVRMDAPSEEQESDDEAWTTVVTKEDITINSRQFIVVNADAQYVRIHSLAKSANFFRLKELRVFGVDWVDATDTEKPVMVSAELESKTDNSAAIAVEATDDQEVAFYHVVDAGNEIDVKLIAVDGKITITGLNFATQYAFVISAIDRGENESENAITVNVATDKGLKLKLATASYIAKVGEGTVVTVEGIDGYDITADGEMQFTVTPAEAGEVLNGKFVPSQSGKATIKAENERAISEEVAVFGYAGDNLALNKEVEVSSYDTIGNQLPKNAVDENEDSQWSAFSENTGEEREYDAWILVDLGDFYDIELIAIRWEGACSKKYHVDFSADKENWRVVFNAGWDAIATHWEYLHETEADTKKVRYVRVWSTEAISQYGIKIKDIKVIGSDWAPTDDTEKPVMVNATLESKTFNSAVIVVEATDNYKVRRYHVVDEANKVNVVLGATDGKISLVNLESATEYKLTITAIDAAGNESENSKEVIFKTDVDKEHPILPAPAPQPELGEKKAVAVFSDAIAGGPAINIGGWAQATVAKAVELAEGDHAFYLYNTNYLGWELAPVVDASGTNTLHVDFYSDDMSSISLTPISPGSPAKEGVYTAQLTAGQWTSVDVPLSVYAAAGIAWNNIFQFKFMNAKPEGTSLFIDNVYFFDNGKTDEAVENVQSDDAQSTKILIDGQVIIKRGEKKYTIMGVEVK